MRKILFIIIVVWFILSLGDSYPQSGSNFHKEWEKAFEFLKHKKFEQAIEAFQKAIEYNPLDPATYYNIACCYSLLNKKEEALIWLEKALEKGFRDYGHIKEDTDLDNIRNEPEFKTLIAKYDLTLEDKTTTLILKGFDPYVTREGEEKLTSYCYLVACARTNRAAVIDPSGGINEILKYLQENGLTLEHVIITHGHLDHIHGLKKLLEKVKPTVYIHEDSVLTIKEWLDNYEDIFPLKDGTIVDIGRLSLTVLHTPGHTEDSVCLYLKDEAKLFSGDALTFDPLNISETDQEYFKKYFSDINPEVKVYTGHQGCLPFANIKKLIESESK